MRSFLKRKSDAAAAQPPSWHPNFRNFELLPDTKVVRTAFFVNAVAITAAVLMLLLFVYQEYQLLDLHRQLDLVEEQIERDRAPSNKMVALHKNFQQLAGRVTEVGDFIKSKPLLSETLLRLAEILPANIALDAHDFRSGTATIRGTVRGAPDQASGYVSSYLQVLKSDPVLSEKYSDVSIVNLSRNPQSGRLLFEIALKLKPTAEPGKKK